MKILLLSVYKIRIRFIKLFVDNEKVNQSKELNQRLKVSNFSFEKKKIPFSLNDVCFSSYLQT